MEYSKYLVKNKPALLKATTCTDSVLTECMAEDIFCAEDEAILLAIPQKIRKSSEFWTIIGTREKCIEKLIVIFRNAKQNAVVDILEAAVGDDGRRPNLKKQAAEECPPNESVAVKKDVGSRFRLQFAQGTNMKDVLRKLVPPFTDVMGNKNANMLIIAQLMTLELFDDAEVEKIKTFGYHTESERINDLFDVIRNTGQDGILECLEKLCNLDELSAASKKHRRLIQNEYPEVVLEQ